MGKTYSNVALKISFNETKVVESVGVGEGRRGVLLQWIKYPAKPPIHISGHE